MVDKLREMTDKVSVVKDCGTKTVQNNWTCLWSVNKHSVEPVLEEVLEDHQGRSWEQMPHHVE